MELLLLITSVNEETAINECATLRSWIQDEGIDNLNVVQPRKKLANDEAGGLLESALYITLGAPAVVQLAKSIQTYFKSLPNINKEKASTLKIKLKTDKGEMEVEGRNLTEDDQDFINKFIKIVKAD